MLILLFVLQWLIFFEVPIGFQSGKQPTLMRSEPKMLSHNVVIFLLAGKAPVSSELCCLSPEQLTTSGCQPTD
jgi:hypothetical protein